MVDKSPNAKLQEKPNRRDERKMPNISGSISFWMMKGLRTSVNYTKMGKFFIAIHVQGSRSFVAKVSLICCIP